MIEQIRKEEKAIAKEKLAVEKDKTKSAQEKIKIEKERREKLELATATALLNKGISIQEIAKIMELSVKLVEGIVGNIN